MANIPNIQPILNGDPTTQIPSIPSPPPSRAPRETVLTTPSGQEVPADQFTGTSAFNKK